MDPYCTLCGTTAMDSDCARGACLDLKENARLRQENEELKKAVILARGTLAALDARCGAKVMREIFGPDLKSVRLTQKRLDEAFAKADPIGAKLEIYHGCFTGDCPHETQAECDKAIAEARAEEEQTFDVSDQKEKP